jgi:hypothetical protein
VITFKRGGKHNSSSIIVMDTINSAAARTDAPMSPISAMKSRRFRIRHSYYNERACDHWECEINKCTHSEAKERTASGALHVEASEPVSTLPPQPLALTSMDSKLPAGNFRPRSKNQKKAPSATSRTESSSARDGEDKEKAEQRPSVAGFMFGGETLAELEGEEETERSIDDLKSTSSGMTSGSSENFKAAVRNIEIVDNTNQRGLFTGTLKRRTNKPHGYGTMAYPDAIYEGQWVNGDWCGFGRLTDINTGDVYQGGFFDNMKHGLGVMKYADGRIYDGMFMLDKLEGKGHLTEVDGTKFWGYWSKDGVPHGRGKKEYPDGKVYDGEFDQGVFAGHGRMTFPDGTWYLGEWCDGLPNGLGMKVDASGDLLFEGMYSSGEPIEASSMRHAQKSSGHFLLYRNSIAPQGHGTLVGPLPRHVYMRPRMDWTLKNL